MAKIWQTITPETWCKGSMQRDANDVGWPDVVHIANPVKRCSVGWIYKEYQKQGVQLVRSFRKFHKTIGTTQASQWNDAPERTFEEVRDAFRKADL